MANMILDGYTFAKQPTSIPQMIQTTKPVGVTPTMDGVAAFEWSASIKGVPVVLRWDKLDTGQYNTLFTKYATGGQITFDPQDGSTKTFDVIVSDCRGEYYMAMENAAGNQRQNVELTLIIIDEQ